MILELPRSSPLRTPTSPWSTLTLPPQKWRSRKELLRSSRTTLEQFTLRKNSALERNPELKSTSRWTPFFKKFNVKMNFELKIKCDLEILCTSDLSKKPSVGPNLVRP
jgi:hypothetical protein